jgi:hypothetical protein
VTSAEVQHDEPLTERKSFLGDRREVSRSNQPITLRTRSSPCSETLYYPNHGLTAFQAPPRTIGRDWCASYVFGYVTMRALSIIIHETTFVLVISENLDLEAPFDR